MKLVDDSNFEVFLALKTTESWGGRDKITGDWNEKKGRKSSSPKCEVIRSVVWLQTAGTSHSETVSCR